MIKENGKLENIRKIEHLLPQVPYQEIRDIFLTPEAPKVDKIEFGEVDRHEVLEFLCVNKSFSTERVSTTLDKWKSWRIQPVA